jgi:predicted permease
MTVLSGVLARVRSLGRALRGYSAIEAEMSEEFRLHVELRTADLVGSGLAPAEAMRVARREFGNRERYKDEGRESRGLRRVDALRVSWLDFKLGFRMLIKYPGLTLVGGVAIAFGIWIGAATFELMTQVMHPTLGLPGGDRLVGIRMWDAKANRGELRLLHDVMVWRAEMKSVTDIGAFRTVRRNLITEDGAGEPIAVMEISPLAFRVTRVPPLLGRALIDADAMTGAPPVVVIGHELWKRRFGGDPAIVGRTIQLGRERNTIVGVMPTGYEFPVNNSFWAPLRVDTQSVMRRQGPAVRIFGVLAPGASIEAAQAEIAAIGLRTATDYPDTHEHLRPEVLPYARSIFELEDATKALFMSANIPALMLITLICGNVALLMFARAATRETEMVVRTALGATRQRIIMQLFAEALVLGSVAAVIGLALAGRGLAALMHIFESNNGGEKLPFWFEDSLSATTVTYAAILTILAAVIAGVGPALKVTRGMGSRLKAIGMGAGEMRFGGVWTAVIVVQVAVTVAFPGVTFFIRGDGIRLRTVNVGVAEQEFLRTRFEMDREPPPGAPSDTSRAQFLARYAAAYAELQRRLMASGSVEGITFADRLPRMDHSPRLVELDAGEAAPLNPGWPDGYRVSVANVDPGYFAVVSAPVLTGRGFQPGDLEANAVAVIVNESFVRLVLGGRNPIGRRIRHLGVTSEPIIPLAQRGPWYEIVGVVPDLGMSTGKNDPKMAGIYHPARVEDVYPAQIAVHVRGAPESLIPTVHAVAAQVDPTIRLYDTSLLADASSPDIQLISFAVRVLTAISALALLLSLAGIYAVLSFTVARRTREIGIRVALGASRRRVVVAIFTRPVAQVAVGIGAGVVLLIGLSVGSVSNIPWGFVGALALHGVVMLLVCMLACVVPTQRVLAIQPTEALRGDV